MRSQKPKLKEGKHIGMLFIYYGFCLVNSRRRYVNQYYYIYAKYLKISSIDLTQTIF